MVRNKLLVIGVLLLLFGGAWRVFLSPRWLQRIPPGWEFQMRYVGIHTNAPPGSDSLPRQDVLSEYLRTIRLIDEEGRPDSVVVEDTYLLKEIETGKVQYNYQVRFAVDPRTGAHVANPQEIFLFPRFVEKKTYKLRASFVKGIPMRFLREDRLESLQTYVFGYNGRGEYTDFYEGIVDGQLQVVPDSIEIRCADDQFRYRAWIEPVTGRPVKMEESCLSGDYAYSKRTGEQLYAVDRFFGVTFGDDVVDGIDQARLARLSILWLGKRVPIILALAGIICVLLTFLRRRSGQ